jgi:hypothetical protein
MIGVALLSIFSATRRRATTALDMAFGLFAGARR